MWFNLTTGVVIDTDCTGTNSCKSNYHTIMATPKYEKNHWKEEFEDTKGVIKIRKLKKNRQQNKVKKTSRFVITHVVHYSILVNKQQSMYYLGVYLNFNFEQSLIKQQ
jgi:hypothetical protein